MTAIVAAVTAIAAVAWLALVARVGLVAARMLQIEEYENRRFAAWAATRPWLLHRASVAGGLVAAVGLAAALVAGAQARLSAGVAWLLAAGVAHATWGWIAPKRALAVTARMRRLLGAAAIVPVAAAVGVALLIALAAPWSGAAGVLIVALGATALPVAALLLANIAMRPVEAAVRTHYLRRAHRRIEALHPHVIAVAGSYGKTSTKHILASLLGDDVLPTRKSFNTLMGVTRVVNEDLTGDHRIFVVEMDAYARGEIAAICDLVHPRAAIITSVGPQHLERFGSMASIEDALFEAVAALPEDGIAVIHTGDEGGAALAARPRPAGATLVRYALEGSGDADVVASDVRIGAGGTSFRWSWPARRLEHTVTTPLLGRHQALNISAALAMVELQGRSLDSAVRAAGSLLPVEHRLQVLAAGGPVTVIDDSYNANPVGVHEGLDVLATFDGGARILVTPGLVELGTVEEAENRRYGRHAAAVCDHVIVAEARPAAALRQGLREGGMAAERVHTVHDLAETTALIARLTKAGDVVLFANDLPDTYMTGSRARTAVTAVRAGG